MYVARDGVLSLLLIVPQSSFGGKPLIFQVVCPHDGTASLKGLKKTKNNNTNTNHTVGSNSFFGAELASYTNRPGSGSGTWPVWCHTPATNQNSRQCVRRVQKTKSRQFQFEASLRGAGETVSHLSPGLNHGLKVFIELLLRGTIVNRTKYC